jgi:hypothetical protein
MIFKPRINADIRMMNTDEVTVATRIDLRLSAHLSVFIGGE